MNITNNTNKTNNNKYRLNKSLSAIIVALAIIILLSSFSFVFFAKNLGIRNKLFNNKISNLDECLAIINKESINQLPEKKEEPKTCKEAVEALDDEYSSFFTQSEYDKFINSVNNTYSGIGIAIDRVKDTTKDHIAVTKVFDQTSAQEAGLKTGDIIKKINDEEIIAQSTEQVSSKIRGEEGTTVKLNIQSGEQNTDKTIKRVKVEIPNISVLKEDNIGIVSISSFSMNLYKEFKAKTQVLVDDKAIDTILIDLRDNSGGSLESAIDLISAFVPKNTHIVTEKLKEEDKKLYTRKDPIFENKKIVLVSNEMSASASEITLIALKEKANAKIIGKKSYGKGVVQQLLNLSSGEIIKLTIAEWISPNGTKINKQGVSPDKDLDLQQEINNPEILKIVKEI